MFELVVEGDVDVPLVEGSIAEEAGGEEVEGGPKEDCRQNRSGRVGVVLGLILFAKRRRGEILPTGDSFGGVSVFPNTVFFVLSVSLALGSSGPAASLKISSTPFISASILAILSCNSFHLDFISANLLRTSPFFVLRSAIPFPRILRTLSHAGE